MNNLEKYSKKFMLKTMSGGKYIITDVQEKAFRNISDKSMIIINGNHINTSTITEILSLDEYYRQFPEEIPAYVPETFKAENVNKSKSINALELMLKGFDSTKNTNSNSRLSIREKMVNKLSLIKNSVQENYTVAELVH